MMKTQNFANDVIVNQQLNGFTRALTYIAFFTFGAAYPVVINDLLNDYFNWENGLRINFRKPWFLTWGNCFGFSIFIIPELILKIKFNTYSATTWNFFRACSLPGLCLMLSTLINMYSLVYLTPSSWKVMQFFGLLFTTIINSALNLNRSILRDWTGLFFVFVGLMLAGAYTLFISKDYKSKTPSNILYAILFMIVSELVKTAQYKIEEIMLHESNASPIEVLSCEGLWGLFFVTFIAMPLAMTSNPTSGLIISENTIESFKMIARDKTIIALWFLIIICISFYTWIGTIIIADSNTVRRNILDAIMPIFVWIFSIISHFSTENENIGERVYPSTIVEIAGFLFCIFGALIYNGTIHVPYVTYENEEEDEEELNPIQKNEISDNSNEEEHNENIDKKNNVN